MSAIRDLRQIPRALWSLKSTRRRSDNIVSSLVRQFERYASGFDSSTDGVSVRVVAKLSAAAVPALIRLFLRIRAGVGTLIKTIPKYM